jgi:hypothetical protein
MAELGPAQREQATLLVLTQQAIKTTKIEGERLHLEFVRSAAWQSVQILTRPINSA